MTPASDAARLQSWFAEGRIERPDADVRNIVDLSRAVATLAGAPDVAETAGARAIADAIGAADHIVLVMVDGLGMNLVEALPAGSFLRRHVAMELRTVFPSGTPAALTSLATGRWPGQHAVIGWFTYLVEPGLTAIILPFVERSGRRPLDEHGVTSDAAFPVPSLVASFQHEPAAFMPAHIAGSVYSRYFSAGAPPYPYASLAAAADAVAGRIAGAARPTYAYFYIPWVDAAEHEDGVRSEAVRRALRGVEQMLSSLAARVPSGARLVVSADHGQIDVPDEHTHMLPEDDALLRLLLAAPSGDPRVPLFHVRAGCHEAFERAFRERFGEHFALLRAAEADGLRLFGPEPLSDEARRRIGDYAGIAGGDHVLTYGAPTMRGYHGGLLRDEMRIPLIVV